MKRMQGISVIEVLIAFLIVAVLAGIALPASVSMYTRFGFDQTAMTLGESVLTSSRTAVATGSATIICPTAQNGGCRQDSDWSQGWMAFADVDDDRELGPRDTLIGRYAPWSQRLRISSNDGRKRIVFQPDGASAGTNLTFTLCSRDTREARVLALANSGRFRIAATPGDVAQRCWNQ
jgi:type IV fimbrial biogenesis protein FimT